MASHVVVAEIVRSGFVEGRHRGSVVRVGPDGEVQWSLGDVESPVFPRSCNKPMQATAMVRNGLPERGRLLALATASHDGERMHIDAVRELLDRAGLDEMALQTPPELPAGQQALIAYVRSGHERSAIAMNCSGKHAAMLATCVHNGWPTESYLDRDHPLQAAIAGVFEELVGDPIAATGVDGCGAPLFAASLTGMARAFGRMVQAGEGSAERAVCEAIAAYPEYVSGTRNADARLVHAFPGAIGKSGAEACHVFAMPDGTAFACKIEDGADRARPVVLAEAMRVAGYDHAVLDELSTQVLYGGMEDGHNRPVGEIRPAFP